MRKLILAVFALFLFVNCSSNSNIDSLLNKLTSNDVVPDTQALHELIKIGAPAIQPTIDKLNEEKEPWRQQYYLILLYNIANEDNSNDILPFAKSENGNVREWAILVLSKIGDQNSIGTLIKSLSDSAVEDLAKEKAVLRLQHLTGQSIPFLKSMPFKEKKLVIKKWQNYLNMPDNTPQLTPQGGAPKL